MKVKRNRLVVATYLAAITLCIGTFTMSVAWYNNSTRLQISTVEITLDCDRQLGISLEKDKGFTSELDTKDFGDTGFFVPVTSAHQDRWFKDQKDMPVFYDDTLYTEQEDASTTNLVESGYFSRKLYLKSNDDVWVSFDPEQTYIHPHSEINGNYARELYDTYQKGQDEELKALTVEDIENRLNSLVSAMRYSILVNDEGHYSYCIIDPNKSEVTRYGGLLDNNVDRYYDYFYKGHEEYGYERLYGEYNDKDLIVYSELPEPTDSDYEDMTSSPSAFNAMHKKSVKKIDFAASEQNGLEIKEEQSYSVEDFKAADKPFYIPVYYEKATEIVLSIYIEGWDFDSINYTMGATFVANMVFTIEREQ